MISKVRDLISQRAELKKLKVREYVKEVFIEYKLVFITLLNFFLYIFLMQYIGFIITTIIFIIVTAIIIGPKKKKDLLVATIVSVVITVSTYIFFQNVLYVRFPSGLFF
ncbi:hypothetical protein JCM9140_3316 [Halalkalibacter wakoensis JCM 9140]|uniref:DUF1468 domain-containing protein n=1 Tax=Halalkalibacter wakoensis JCM 9140 TaxID=1236970 RepID=W4Q5B7_9BACI|nr:hypothetical protein JCM9140_3316 [Halalkalibacter wakoensis JCM 9140]